MQRENQNKRARLSRNDHIQVEPSIVLRVHPMPLNASYVDLHDAFSRFGYISYATCMMDTNEGLVEFEMMESAKNSINRLLLECATPTSALIITVHNIKHHVDAATISKIGNVPAMSNDDDEVQWVSTTERDLSLNGNEAEDGLAHTGDFSKSQEVSVPGHFPTSGGFNASVSRHVDVAAHNFFADHGNLATEGVNDNLQSGSFGNDGFSTQGFGNNAQSGFVERSHNQRGATNVRGRAPISEGSFLMTKFRRFNDNSFNGASDPQTFNSDRILVDGIVVAGEDVEPISGLAKIRRLRALNAHIPLVPVVNLCQDFLPLKPYRQIHVLSRMALLQLMQKSTYSCEQGKEFKFSNVDFAPSSQSFEDGGGFSSRFTSANQARGSSRSSSQIRNLSPGSFDGRSMQRNVIDESFNRDKAVKRNGQGNVFSKKFREWWLQSERRSFNERGGSNVMMVIPHFQVVKLQTFPLVMLRMLNLAIQAFLRLARCQSEYASSNSNSRGRYGRGGGRGGRGYNNGSGFKGSRERGPREYRGGDRAHNNSQF
uniref:RRM domain-containing protein n=1 Tax=Ditylenchus dipsaci TaxID=166011 RepID=A0A915E680_9BILA